ncbi:MAG TPA: GAF domain-containing protein [Candidatus Ozemobacteraceae bacterium]
MSETGKDRGASLTTAQVEILIATWRRICVEEHLEGIYTLLVETARKLTDAEHASIALIEEGKLRFVGSTRDDHARRGAIAVPLGSGIPGKVAQDGIGRRIESGGYISPVTRAAAPPTGQQEHSSMACVPLKVREEIIGTIQVYNRIGATKFAESDLEALQVLADHSSVTVERLRLQKNLMIETSRVRGIFQALTDGIMVVDTAGNPILYNQAVESMFFPEGKQNYALSTYISNVIRTGDAAGGTSEVALLKPHEMILSNRFVTLRDADGKPAEVIVSIRNISDQRAIERRFSQFYALMLHHHNRLVAKAWRHRGKKTVRRLLCRQRESMRHLISLTELKSGPLRIERGNCSLTDLYVRVRDRFANRFAKAGIVIDDGDLLAHGQIAGRFDRGRMLQIYRTLFRKARKVLAGGGRNVWKAEAKPGHVEISIGFEGERVGERIPEDILDWNAQVDRILSGESSALDLDLAFLSHVVHAHKGTIAICRTDNHQVTVRLSLPLER